MNPQQKDNAGAAPIIPTGTERTVFGNASFLNGQGQAQTPAPNAVNGAAQAPQAVQPAPEQGITFAELAQKKGFKSADDLARSYANLESAHTKTNMSLADILAARSAPVAPVQDAPQMSLPPQLADDEAVKVVQTIVQNAVRPLQEKLKQQDDIADLRKVFDANSDAQQFAEAMANIVKKNPTLPWEDAYKLAKFDSLAQSTRTQATQEAYKTIGVKQQIQPTGVRATPKGGEEVRNLIKDRSVPFSEIQKIMRDRLSQ